MNMLYRACASKRNYMLRVLEALRKKKVFEKCTVISQTLDSGDNYPNEYYHEIKAQYGYHTSYNAICDYDALPAVPMSVWEAMLPFKSVILDMTCRICHMHIMNYDEMEMLYIKHVRFWNYVMEADQIEFCFFSVVPHTAWEYTIYALAKIKKIPTLLIDEHWVTELNTVATDIKNLGSSAAICFSKYQAIGMDQPSQSFYHKIAGEHLVFTNKEKSSEISIINRLIKKYFHKSFPETIKKLIKMNWRFLKGDDPYITIRTIWNCKLDVEYSIRQMIFEKKYKGKSYYDKKIASKLNLNEKYILFALQYTPEGTTLPKAGVFSNQLLTIQLLAEAAKEKGIKVYVKEHWSQWKRPAQFYNELSVIPNVYFVKSDIGNDILMEHAFVVASQTGSCIIESFIRGIPCLTFAYHAAAEAPGVYYVRSKEEIIKAIAMAESNRQPSVEEAKKYFAAICKTSVRSSLDWPVHPKYSLKEYMVDLVGLITDYVAKGMPDQYYYENKNI